MNIFTQTESANFHNLNIKKYESFIYTMYLVYCYLFKGDQTDTLYGTRPLGERLLKKSIPYVPQKIVKSSEIN